MGVLEEGCLGPPLHLQFRRRRVGCVRSSVMDVERRVIFRLIAPELAWSATIVMIEDIGRATALRRGDLLQR